MVKIRRRKYLINKPLQFAYSGIAIWLLLVGIILAGTLTYYITMNTILTRMESSSAFSVQAYQLVREINSLLSRRIGWLLAGLVVLTGGLEIFYMHRIAGPVYRMERTLREALEGKAFSPIRLREKDFFKGLAEALNRFMAFQQSKDEKVKILFKDVQQYPGLKEKARDLEKLLS